MTRETAEKVIQQLLSASEALNETVRLVQSDVSQSMIKDYRRRVAEVMATIYLDLMKPITAPYPDLDPGLEDDSGTPGDGG